MTRGGASTAGTATAVVIGASMAGLAAAKALTGHFEQVVVIERDRLPEGPHPRPGVPQGRHLHALLPRGAMALDGLFPGLLDELVADGAPSGDVLGDARWHLNGHRLARGDIGHDAIPASRPFTEAHVLARLRRERGVAFVEESETLGVTATRDGRRVTGVRVGQRSRGRGERSIPADLVVDCSGRRSRTPSWLRDHGYVPPPQEQLRVDLHYATRHYRLADDVLDGDLGLVITPTAASPRPAAMARIEGDRWLVVLGGMAGERPPLDPARYERYAASLSCPDLHRAICSGTPLDEPVPFRYPASVRNRYERLQRFPDGLLVAGDAVCSFNPIYGQGMTVAAVQAELLGKLLGAGSPLTARRWFPTIKPLIDVAWDLAIGSDLALPQIEAHRSPKVRLLNRYVARLQATAAHDPALAVGFMRVAGLLDPPQRLLHPATIARVMRGPRPNGSAAPPPLARTPTM